MGSGLRTSVFAVILINSSLHYKFSKAHRLKPTIGIPYIDHSGFSSRIMKSNNVLQSAF